MIIKRVILLHIILASILLSYESDARVGVLTPYTNADDPAFADSAAQAIREEFHKRKGFDVYLEKRMRQEYTAIDDDFPEFCRDPRCAAALGR
ncbi:MAG: hypothetical protein ACQEQV_04420, partial [Fibrobacterota bacterium]